MLFSEKSNARDDVKFRMKIKSLDISENTGPRVIPQLLRYVSTGGYGEVPRLDSTPWPCTLFRYID